MSMKNEISAYVEKLDYKQQQALLDFLATLVKLIPEGGDIVVSRLTECPKCELPIVLHANYTTCPKCGYKIN